MPPPTSTSHTASADPVPSPPPLTTIPPIPTDSHGNALPNHQVTLDNVSQILALLPTALRPHLKYHPSRHLWTLPVSSAPVTDLPLRIAGAPLLPVTWKSEGWEWEPRKGPLEDTAKVREEVLERLAEMFPTATGYCFLIDGSVVVCGDYTMPSTASTLSQKAGGLGAAAEKIELNSGKPSTSALAPKDSKEAKAALEKKLSQDQRTQRKGSDTTPVTVDGYTVVHRPQMQILPMPPSPPPPQMPGQALEDSPVDRAPGDPVHMRMWRYVLGADSRQPLSGYNAANVGVRVRCVKAGEKEGEAGKEYYTVPIHLKTESAKRFKKEALEVQRQEAEEKKKRAGWWEKIVRKFGGKEEVKEEELTAFDIDKVMGVWWGNGRSKDAGLIGEFVKYFDPLVANNPFAHYPTDFNTDLGLLACNSNSPSLVTPYPLTWHKTHPIHLPPSTPIRILSPNTNTNGWVLPVGHAYLPHPRKPGTFAYAMVWRDVSGLRRDMTSGGPIAVEMPSAADGPSYAVCGFQNMYIGEDYLNDYRKGGKPEWAFFGSFVLPRELYGAFEIVNCVKPRKEVEGAKAKGGVSSISAPGMGGGTMFSKIQQEAGKAYSKAREEAATLVGKTESVAAEQAHSTSDATQKLTAKGAEQALDYAAMGAVVAGNNIQQGINAAKEIGAEAAKNAGPALQKGTLAAAEILGDAARKMEPAVEGAKESAKESAGKTAEVGKNLGMEAAKNAGPALQKGTAATAEYLGERAKKIEPAVEGAKQRAEKTTEVGVDASKQFMAEAGEKKEAVSGKAKEGVEETKDEAAKKKEDANKTAGATAGKTKEYLTSPASPRHQKARSRSEDKDKIFQDFHAAERKALENAHAGMKRPDLEEGTYPYESVAESVPGTPKKARLGEETRQEAEEVQEKGKEVVEEKVMAAGAVQKGKEVKDEGKAKAEETLEGAKKKLGEGETAVKDTAKKGVEKAKETAGVATEKGKEAVSETAKKGEETATYLQRKASDKAKETKEKTKEAATTVERKASQKSQTATEKTEQAATSALDKGKEKAADLHDAGSKTFAQAAEIGKHVAEEAEAKAEDAEVKTAHAAKEGEESASLKLESGIKAVTANMSPAAATAASKLYTGLSSGGDTSKPTASHPKPHHGEGENPLEHTATLKILASRPKRELTDRNHQAVENMCSDDVCVTTTPRVGKVKDVKEHLLKKKCVDGVCELSEDCTCEGGVGSSDRCELEESCCAEEEKAAALERGRADKLAGESAKEARKEEEKKEVESGMKSTSPAEASPEAEDEGEESPEAEGAAGSSSTGAGGQGGQGGEGGKKKKKKKGKGKKK